MTLRVVLATHNQHKVEEFQRILGADASELEIVAYDGPEPVEDGASFAENALIKARAAAAHTGLISLADDSGICVDVMGGAPGIFSARWAGTHGDSAANLRLLLDQMGDMPAVHRRAHFSCSIAVVVPENDVAAARVAGVEPETVVEGIWPGQLASEASGANGFGYDPIFLPDGYPVSAAELAPAEKDAVSHRARAFAMIAPTIAALTGRE